MNGVPIGTSFLQMKGNRMRITVLVENTAMEPLRCEHGLSLFIEFQGENYLLDAGTTDLFLENAKRLDVPVYDVKTCILSHGHYDHSGGFGTYLSENKEAVLYMMEHADEEYLSGKGELHEIGIPKEVIERHRERFHFINQVTRLAENVYLVPHHSEGMEQIGRRAKLYKMVDGELMPDDFKHELSLVLDTEKGLVICNSCSHGGVKNIVSEVQERFPGKTLYAFVGGLHMKGGEFSEEEIRGVAEYLKSKEIQYLYTGHCTGEAAFQILKKYGGDMVQDLMTGKVIDICQ